VSSVSQPLENADRVLRNDYAIGLLF
jgi:hypothetical protein